MWQYTTETIINSNKGHLGAKKDERFDVQQGKLLIEGVGAFDLSKIDKVWKRAYQPAEKAYKKVGIPSGKITEGEVYRLQVWVSEEGTIRPELQNAMLMKSLPFQFEVVAPAATYTENKSNNDEHVQLAVALEKAVEKMFAKKGADKLFTLKANNGSLEIEATDCYVRFDEIRLDKINDSDSKNGSLTGYRDYNPVALTANTTTTGVGADRRGTEGNGTVARLVKNLRLPTKTSLDPFGADQGGKPVPGGEYAQYMFEYVTDRSHVGHQVFGSVGDQSLTTHILFLNEKDAALISTFEGFFGGVYGTDNTDGKVYEYEPESIYAATNNAPKLASAQEGRGAKK
jgi:hypothetical protein